MIRSGDEWRAPKKFPRCVNLLGLHVDVRLVDPGDRAIAGAEAVWDAARRTISINRRAARRRKWYLLLHEATHAMHDLIDEALRTGEVRVRRTRREASEARLAVLEGMWSASE